MTALRQTKGPWTHRSLTVLFSSVFGLLCFWLTGFVIADIGSWPGPAYADLESQLLDPDVADKLTALQRDIEETDRLITDQETRQTLLRDSTSNSQRTMQQLLEFQRLSLQKNVTPSAEEQKALADSQRQFLANQEQYQLLNEQIVAHNEALRDLRLAEQDTQSQLADLREPIREQYRTLKKQHDFKAAAVKLAVLVPLLIVGGFLFFRLRNGPYAPAVYALDLALLLRVGIVMHEYFPSKYFKYVLIGVAIAIVLRILIHLLRIVAFPRRTWLLKQYKEAYEALLCPMCSFPIRRGPLKFMSWTRRTIRKVTVPMQSVDSDEPYFCPMCSTPLYEPCAACEAVRHSLLPSCQKCGHLKDQAEHAPGAVQNG